jgi:hypothetical protein
MRNWLLAWLLRKSAPRSYVVDAEFDRAPDLRIARLGEGEEAMGRTPRRPWRV